MARRPKRSPEREAAILLALEIGNTRRAAANGADIHVDTLADWMRDPAFSAAVTNAEAKAEQRFLSNVAQAATAGDSWQAAAWWLERRRHEEYARRDKVDMTIDVKREAERIAAANGLDPAAVIAEAERVLAGQT
jgi:hypothetical protein